MKGKYEPIPNAYSQDLGILIDTLLQKNPNKRPTWDKILSMPIITRRIEKYFPHADIENDTVSILMSTIKVPRNLLYLTDKLPKSKYIGAEYINKSMINSSSKMIK